MRRHRVHRLLLSLLVALAMGAGCGHAASAMVVHAGHVTHMAAGEQPAAPHHHHHTAGCACCSMACCAVVLPSPVMARAAQSGIVVAYTPLLVDGRGVTTALDPDPPRPSTL